MYKDLKEGSRYMSGEEKDKAEKVLARMEGRKGLSPEGEEKLKNIGNSLRDISKRLEGWEERSER